MLKLSLHIERVVTATEAAAIAAIVNQLKSVDQFKLENVADEPAETVEKAPVAPSRPVIVPTPRKPRRHWDRRIQDAFNMTSVKMPGSSMELSDLRDSFAWEVSDTNEWEPFKVSEFPGVLSVMTPEQGFHLVRVFLKELGREPAKGDTVLLPPLRAKWLEKQAEEDRERQKRNMELTGDPHIGPAVPLPGEATIDNGFVDDLLDSLEWGKPEYEVMSMREFLTWAGVKYNKGNAIKVGRAAKALGGFKLDHRRGGYLYLRFPLPKDFAPPYPSN